MGIERSAFHTLVMKFFSFSLIALGTALALGACGSDEDDPKTSERVQPAECKPISEACHDVDHDGDPEAHECHEGAHSDWTGEECSQNAANCIAICEALHGDGGGGTSGTTGDSGDQHDE